MKAVVLTLALLFLTGSQAQHETQQEEPPSQWEQVKAFAQMYLKSAKVRGREYIVKFEETDLAKKLNLTVLEKLDTLSNKVADLQKQLNPVAQTIWDKLKKEGGMLTGELNKDLAEVMKPYLEGIQKKWQERVELLGQALPGSVQEELQELQKKLRQLGETVRDGSRTLMDRARGQVFSERMFSLLLILQSFGEDLHQCMEPGEDKLRECLEPYGEQLRKHLHEHLGLAELRKQVEPTLQPLWESLQDLFQPFL
ncbi:Apolipoprotein A-I [Myotis davidii]|uniref:Apolipoprotein A-I n=1 Tax=Myotis davidii TaxID=225400 RepID=L5M2H9_MYODS|nr:Apolipoprotein A-I [Myotis davidii]